MGRQSWRSAEPVGVKADMMVSVSRGVGSFSRKRRIDINTLCMHCLMNQLSAGEAKKLNKYNEETVKWKWTRLRKVIPAELCGG